MNNSYPYYIITGPPSSGKTTIINELLERGYSCHHEVARKIIKENRTNKVDVFPWNNIVSFSDQVFEHILELLQSLKGEFSFFDRSIVDLIAYMEINGVHDNKKYKKAILHSKYNTTVFFLPFWEEIYLLDNERKETKNKAMYIGETLRKVYTDLGFNLIEVPTGLVEERVKFILASGI